MAITVFAQDADTYVAKYLRRLPYLLFYQEGVLSSGQWATPLKVQAKATPDMSVDVLGGDCIIEGEPEGGTQFSTDYGKVIFTNDAAVNLTITASDPTNPRKDIVIAKLYDDGTAAGSKGQLEVVTGTPAGSPVEPTLPPNAYKLATIDVAAGATSITNANITDKRINSITITAKDVSDTYLKLLAETEVSSAITQVDFTGLNLNSDDFYELIFAFYNGTTLSSYGIYFNDDTTETNYRRNIHFIKSDGTHGRNYSNEALFCSADNVKEAFGTIQIGRGKSTSVPRANINTQETSAGIEAASQSYISWITAVNVTKISLKATVANAIGVGSKFYLLTRSK